MADNTQYLILLILGRITALLSMMGSTAIVLASRHKRKEDLYHRIVFTMSVFDVFSSASLFSSVWMLPTPESLIDNYYNNNPEEEQYRNMMSIDIMPSDDINKNDNIFSDNNSTNSTIYFTETDLLEYIPDHPFAIGSPITCSIQGTAFMVGVAGTTTFSCYLSIYFLLMVRYKWTRSQITERLERKAYWFCAILWGPLVVITLALPGSYNPDDIIHSCLVTELPSGCDFDDTLPCVNGDWRVYYAGWLYFLFIAILAITSCVATYLVYRTVKSTIRQSNQYNFERNVQRQEDARSINNTNNHRMFQSTNTANSGLMPAMASGADSRGPPTATIDHNMTAETITGISNILEDSARGSHSFPDFEDSNKMIGGFDDSESDDNDDDIYENHIKTDEDYKPAASEVIKKKMNTNEINTYNDASTSTTTMIDMNSNHNINDNIKENNQSNAESINKNENVNSNNNNNYNDDYNMNKDKKNIDNHSRSEDGDDDLDHSEKIDEDDDIIDNDVNSVDKKSLDEDDDVDESESEENNDHDHDESDDDSCIMSDDEMEQFSEELKGGDDQPGTSRDDNFDDSIKIASTRYIPEFDNPSSNMDDDSYRSKGRTYMLRIDDDENGRLNANDKEVSFHTNNSDSNRLSANNNNYDLSALDPPHLVAQESAFSAASGISSMGGESTRASRTMLQRISSFATSISSQGSRQHRRRRRRKSTNDRLQIVMWQSLLYTCAYVNTIIWPTFIVLVPILIPSSTQNLSHPGWFILQIIGWICFPLQGWLNYLIYIRRRLQQWRVIYPDARLWFLLWKATFAKEEVFTSQHRPSQISVSRAQDRSEFRRHGVSFWRRTIVSRG